MGEKKKIPEKIQIIYDRTPSYKIHRVDGAHGGITPRGDIFLDLYYEVTSPPKSETKKVKSDQRLGETLELERDGDIKRIIECAITMDIKTAVQIKNWLELRINHYPKVKDEKDSKSEQ